jgi:soluble lytic murein transglycosylase
MKLSKISLLIFTIVFSGILHAQTHEKIMRAVEQRNYPLAAAELDNLKKSDPKIFEVNNYDYLLARMAEKKGDYAAAMANYQSVANRNSVLKEYALWHLARIARSSGNLMLERTFLQEILTFAPDSLLIEATKNRLARSYFESKNYDTAIRLLSGQASSNAAQTKENPAAIAQQKPLNAQSRENLVLLAQAFLQSGKTEQARETFTKLITGMPNPGQPDDFALAGARGLDALEVGAEKFGKTAPALSDYEHLRRAQIYAFNRDFADARLHYRAIIENHPASGLVPDAIYQIGRGYVQMGEFVEAINWFERVQEQFPEHPVSRDALSQAASAYSRVNKPREAVSRYQKLIEKHADAENLERAYLNIVDVLRDAGENGDALKWTMKTQEVFRGKLPEALALFAQARIHIAQSDWRSALADLDKLQTFSDLGGTRVPGGTNKTEIVFLKGLALENLNRYPEAIDVYLSIPDGRGEYYGWRATERLKSLANNEKTSQFVRQKFDSFHEKAKQSVSANNAEIVRQSAQSALRLLPGGEVKDESASANITKKESLLNILREAYSLLPNYQKIPNYKVLELGRKDSLREKRETKEQGYHQNLADELLFLGLYDEAAPELEKARSENTGKQFAGTNSNKKTNTESNTETNTETNPKSKIQNPKSDDFAYTLAVFYRRGDMAHRAVGFAEPLWRSVPADYQTELIPRDQIELLYPAPYADSLLKYAPERQVDPRFLLSIMRQESRYRADVKSNAAARGLMQFISTTANQIAGQVGRENFVQDELYNPPTAVLFGSQYLSNLFKQFPNQPAAVAASYNGGEINMARWLARSKSDSPDRYVPEIIFSQSKDYVYKVLANYRVYQMFYDENLKFK